MLLYLLNTNIVKFIFILSPIGSFFAMIAQLTVSIQASTPVIPDPDSEWRSGVTYRDLDPELCDYGPGKSFSWLLESSLRSRTYRALSCGLLGLMARGLSLSLHSTLALVALLAGTLLVHSPTSCKLHSVSHVFSF